MKNLREKLKNLFQRLKKLSFSEAIVILITFFIISIVLISFTSPNEIKTLVGPLTNGTPNDNNSTFAVNPFVSSIDKNTLYKVNDSTYAYQNGIITIEGDVGTFFYQDHVPTDDEKAFIAISLKLVDVILVDERYKKVEKPQPDFEQIDKGLEEPNETVGPPENQ